MKHDAIINTDMTSPCRVRLLMTTRSGALGCAWLVTIPLAVFILCQLYQLQLLPEHPPPIALLSSADLGLSRQLTTNLSRPAAAGQQAGSLSRLFDLEREVTERYLLIQLALAASSGRLYTGRQGPPLADVGTLRDLRTFQPLLTPREKAHLLYLFELFTNACRNDGLSFFLLDSSLVGSVRHHGLIPWSDVSITVGMSGQEKETVREVLEKVEGVTLLWPNPYIWSLRLHDSPPDPPSFSRMTFLRIYFYQRNDTHLWVDRWSSQRLFTAPLHRVFPLVLRPFEGQLTPAPCDVTSVLRPGEVQQCRAVLEDTEELVFRDAGPLQCDVLARVFPFVARRVAIMARSWVEQVMVNGTLLYTVLVEGACESDIHSFWEQLFNRDQHGGTNSSSYANLKNISLNSTNKSWRKQV